MMQAPMAGSLVGSRCRCHPGFDTLWNGLLGAWCPMLGPGGAVVRDLSGRRNDGAIVGAPDWQQSGLWRLRTDLDQYVAMPRKLGVVRGLSVLWRGTHVQLTSSIRRMIAGQFDAGSTQYRDWAMPYIDAGYHYNGYLSYSGSTVPNIISTTVAAVGRVDTVVMTWDGLLLSLYVNGAQDATPVSADAVLTNNYGLRIGGPFVNTFQSNALTEAFIVWGRALLPREVARVSADPAGMFRARSVRGGRRCGAVVTTYASRRAR